MEGDPRAARKAQEGVGAEEREAPRGPRLHLQDLRRRPVDRRPQGPAAEGEGGVSDLQGGRRQARPAAATPQAARDQRPGGEGGGPAPRSDHFHFPAGSATQRGLR